MSRVFDAYYFQNEEACHFEQGYNLRKQEEEWERCEREQAFLNNEPYNEPLFVLEDGTVLNEQPDYH